MRRGVLLLSMVLLLLALGCAERSPSEGFRLPPGDPHQGRMTFASMGCASCHRVPDADLPAPNIVPAVALGGVVPVVPTAGELTTEIINPSARVIHAYSTHETAWPQEPMPEYAHRLTVQQVADVVAFLQPRYIPVPSPD
jgi:mono/diheme cytochrome c family protein